MRSVFFCLLALTIAAWGVPAPAQTTTEPSKDHLDRLQNYRTRILDPQARPDERRNWAEELIKETLRVQSAPSKGMVVELLGLAANPDAQRAVCEAIRSGSSGNNDRLDDAFVAPLLELLGSNNSDIRTSAARALAEFSGRAVPEQLAALARQDDAAMVKRQAAIDALAPNIDRREVVQQLVGLLDCSTPEMVSRVVAALEPASREPFGHDVARWKTWWSEKSALSEQAWLSDQVRLYRDRVRSSRSDFDTYRERSKKQLADMAGKLRDFQREVFRTLPVDQREARLVDWLADPHDEVKLTAMSILIGRIADEGKRPEGEVLASLMRLLKEGSAPVRREVLSIVQNLSDPAIAKAVIAQLDEEKDTLTREALFRAVGKLRAQEAQHALVKEISSSDAPSECAREAAIALGQIARLPGSADRFREAVGPLRARYQNAPPHDASLRAGLLSAMSGVADPSFATEFLEAVESDNPLVLRPAIEGLQAVGEGSKLSRLRRYTAHPDPLIRLAAIEAVGRLGREDADVESVLARLNPTVETNELAREAAWRAFRDMLRAKPVRERIRAAAMLRDVPDREVEYLTELASDLTATKNNDADLEMIRDRLSNLLLTQGKFAEAIPHLREIYTHHTERRDPGRLDAGLRLLDATLRSPGYTNAPDLLKQLAEAAGKDEYVITRIVETVAQYLDSPETVADPVRTRAVLDELKQVPPDVLGPNWRRLLQRVSTRLEAAERTTPASSAP